MRGQFLVIAVATTILFHDAASAEPTNATDVAPLKAALWLAAETADSAALEELLSRNHEDFRKGRLSADVLRDLNAEFATTDPGMRAAVDNWLKDIPRSPYALTADAWLHWNAGKHMRGIAGRAHTWPEAMERSASDFRQGLQSAEAAFATFADYPPASDAVLRLGLHFGLDADPVLERAMNAAPSRGTLVRAMSFSLPQWGGETEDARRWCETYADLVTDAEGYNPEICLVDAVYSTDDHGPLRDQAMTILARIDAGYLDYARVMQSREDCPRDVGACEPWQQYLHGDEANDLADAEAFNRNIGYENVADGKAEWAPVAVIARRQIDRARASLAHDPLNPKLIAALSRDEVFLPDGRIEKLDGTLDTEQRLALLHSQIVQVTPFSPAAWSDYAYALGLLPVEQRLGTPASFYQNAVAYSGHDLHYLATWFGFADQARQELEIARKAADDADSSETIATTCQMVRMARLMQAICGSDDPDGMCPAENSYIGPEPAQLLEQARNENQCGEDLAADVGKLVFQPVDVTWQD